MRTLEDAVGALLGIPIHYYARIDFVGFIEMVDAVGGVDVTVARDSRTRLRRLRVRPARLVDHGRRASASNGRMRWPSPDLQGRRRERLHPGRPTATDPGRPARQGDQRRQPLSSSLPGLLDAVGKTIRSERAHRQASRPCRDHGRDLAARRRQLFVISIRSSTPSRLSYGDPQEPDLPAIRAVAAGLFSAPGTLRRAGRCRTSSVVVGRVVSAGRDPLGAV